jgi:hypothetical protein
VIAPLTGQGFDMQRAFLILGVSVSAYYDWEGRALSARTLRHAWLAGEIAQVHKDSAAPHVPALTPVGCFVSTPNLQVNASKNGGVVYARLHG